jgi:hypothetical protein
MNFTFYIFKLYLLSVPFIIKKVIALKIVFWCNNLYDLFLLALVYKVEIIGELRQRID